ncbi:MAG: hypothetical protein AAF790_12495 [Planctomycetota bacterium]
MAPTAPAEPADNTRLLINRLWAAGLATLVVATWRLWTPWRDTPRVPPLAVLGRVPASVDLLLFGGLLALCVLVVLRPHRRWLLIAAAGCLAGLMSVDQLRWQPWAYQLLVTAAPLATLPNEQRTRWLRVLLVSIYLFAAEAKMDVEFARTIGQQIAGAGAAIVGIDWPALPAALRLAVALTLPIAEAVVGLLLAVRRVRRAGVVAAGLLHAGVVVAVGPLGLNHQAGVLVWNVVFFAFVALLFTPQEASPTSVLAAGGRPGPVSAKLILLVAIAAPLTQPLGWWDRWPAWGLYAPRGERAAVFVHNAAAERLPPGLPVEPATGDGPWRRVRLDEWQLSQTAAPLYPQNRIALALALELDRRARLGAYVAVDLESAANRWTGERTGTQLVGAKQIRGHAARHCWLNWRPAPGR